MSNYTYTLTIDQRKIRVIVDTDFAIDVSRITQLYSVIVSGGRSLTDASQLRTNIPLERNGSNTITTAFSGSRKTLFFPFTEAQLASIGYQISITNYNNESQSYYINEESLYAGQYTNPNGTDTYYPVCTVGSTATANFVGGSSYSGESNRVEITISKIAGAHITQTLTNCVSSYNGSFETQGTTLAISLTADLNYIFLPGSITATYGTVTIAQDGLSAIINVTITSTDLSIVATATTNLTRVEVIEHLINCSSDSPGTGLETESFNITITPIQTEAYETLMHVKSVVSNYGTITISSDRTYATITGTFTEDDLEYTVICEHAYILTLGVLQNAVIDPPVGSLIWESGNDPITITGTTDLIRFYDDIGDPAHQYSYLQTANNVSGPVRYKFIVNADGQSATIYNLTIPYRIGINSNIYVNAYGYDVEFINRTISDIKIYSLYCFDTLLGSTDTLVTLQTAVTNNQYYNGVIKLFIAHIAPIVSQYTKTISILQHNQITAQQVPYCIEYIKTISCGNVEVIGKFGNALDYQADVKIYLPFIGIESLDVNDVMNKTLTLLYVADFISGKASAILYANNIEILMREGVFIETLEFRKLDALSGVISSATASMYGYTPFITIRDRNSINTHTTDVYSYGKIGDFTGYNKFVDIRLVSKCDLEIYEDIIQKLENGVIINPA